MRPGIEMDEAAKAKFLERLAETANVTRSARAAKVERVTVYRHRRKDPEFLKAWDEALELGNDALEDEAIRRGKDGWLEPLVSAGKVVGTVRKYSDGLLNTMLKARRPEKFRERTDTTMSGSMTHTHIGPDAPPRETREEWLERKRREAEALGAAAGSAA